MFSNELDEDSQDKTVITPVNYRKTQKLQEDLELSFLGTPRDNPSQQQEQHPVIIRQFVRFASSPITIPGANPDRDSNLSKSYLCASRREIDDVTPPGLLDGDSDEDRRLPSAKPEELSCPPLSPSLLSRFDAIHEVYKGEELPVNIHVTSQFNTERRDYTDETRFSLLSSQNSCIEYDERVRVEPMNSSLVEEMIAEIKGNTEVLISLSARYQKLQKLFIEAAEHYDEHNDEKSFIRMHHYAKELNMMNTPVNLAKTMMDSLHSAFEMIQDDKVNIRVNKFNK